MVNLLKFWRSLIYLGDKISAKGDPVDSVLPQIKNVWTKFRLITFANQPAERHNWG